MGITVRRIDVPTLDPYLQVHILENKGALSVQSSSEFFSRVKKAENVQLLVRMASGQELPGWLKSTARFGDVYVCSAAVEEVRSIRLRSDVISVKSAAVSVCALDRSIQTVKAESKVWDDFVSTYPCKAYRKVIIGFVDDGLDFCNRNFRHEDGTTRLLAIWDQNSESISTVDSVPYGCHWSREQIDDALLSESPYDFLNYTPRFGAHGTHVVDIAAGGGASTGKPGVARNVDIAFVNHRIKSDLRGGVTDLSCILDGVAFLDRLAEMHNATLVLNLSLGVMAGPHDGSSLAERALSHVAQKPDRLVVLAAGNFLRSAMHAKSEITGGQSGLLQWLIDEGDLSGNYLDGWYTGNAVGKLKITSPRGDVFFVAASETLSLVLEGEVVGWVSHRSADPNNEDCNFGILLLSNAESGVWVLQVVESISELGGTLHCWIERDPNGQSHLVGEDVETTGTLSALATAKDCIVVGAVSDRGDVISLYDESSAGPTRDGRNAPQLYAPGVGIFAAMARSSSDVVAKTGTSMAAPHVSGIAALLMAILERLGDSAKVRQLMVEGAQQTIEGDQGRPIVSLWSSLHKIYNGDL